MPFNSFSLENGGKKFGAVTLFYLSITYQDQCYETPSKNENDKEKFKEEISNEQDVNEDPDFDSCEREARRE